MSAGPPPSEGLSATPRDLWLLAQGILLHRGQICEPVPGLGEDAFLTLRGDHTAQVAWLTAEGLATVGVTSLRADKHWVVASARALAEFAGDHLATDP